MSVNSKGSESGRTKVSGSNIEEVEKGFKLGTFAGTKAIYRKTSAGTFEAHIPHVGIVDSHHTSPAKFGAWLKKTYRRVS